MSIATQESTVKIVGISGKVGVGKTTVARMLCERVPGMEKAAFGTIIKREIADKYAIPLVYFYEAKGASIYPTPERIAAGWPEQMKKRSITVRELMQWYSTGVVGAGNSLYWVAAMREHLREMRARGVAITVIDDARFPDEATMIRAASGVLVRIEAYPGYCAPADTGAHQSERVLDGWTDWDAVFRPEYGEEHLCAVVKSLAAYCRERF